MAFEFCLSSDRLSIFVQALRRLRVFSDSLHLSAESTYVECVTYRDGRFGRSTFPAAFFKSLQVESPASCTIGAQHVIELLQRPDWSEAMWTYKNGRLTIDCSLHGGHHCKYAVKDVDNDDENSVAAAAPSDLYWCKRHFVVLSRHQLYEVLSRFARQPGTVDENALTQTQQLPRKAVTMWWGRNDTLEITVDGHDAAGGSIMESRPTESLPTENTLTMLPRTAGSGGGGAFVTSINPSHFVSKYIHPELRGIRVAYAQEVCDLLRPGTPDAPVCLTWAVPEYQIILLMGYKPELSNVALDGGQLRETFDCYRPKRHLLGPAASNAATNVDTARSIADLYILQTSSPASQQQSPILPRHSLLGHPEPDEWVLAPPSLTAPVATTSLYGEPTEENNDCSLAPTQPITPPVAPTFVPPQPGVSASSMAAAPSASAPFRNPFNEPLSPSEGIIATTGRDWLLQVLSRAAAADASTTTPYSESQLETMAAVYQWDGQRKEFPQLPWIPEAKRWFCWTLEDKPFESQDSQVVVERPAALVAPRLSLSPTYEGTYRDDAW